MTATLTRPNRPAAPGLPSADAWEIDPARAVVSFSGRASFLTPTVSARFLDISGSVSVDADTVGGDIDVAVDVTSMTTGNQAWDDVIATFDPFDVAHFPIATYRSTAVSWTGDEVRIDGVLTLRGVSRSVALTASYAVGRNGRRMLVRAAGTIDRQDFGVRFDLPGLGKIIPRRMRLAIDVDVILAA
jgi:polyisoprenoid-binding protein YceI